MIELESQLVPSDYLVGAYNNRGLAYARKGDFDEAIEDYNQAIELNPKSAVAYQNRGNIYFDQKDFDEAIEDYNQAIEYKTKLDPPDLAGAYYNRGRIYARKANVDQAIVDLRKAIELNPKLDPSDLAVAYNKRGLAYMDRDDLDKAIEDCNQAIEYKTKLAAAYRIPLDKAIEDFTAAIKIKSDKANLYYNRGLAYARKGNMDKAIEDFTAAIEFNPKSDPSALTHAYNNRGLAYMDRDDLDEAIEDCNQAIKHNPKSDPSALARAYNNRGLAYYNRGLARAAKLDVRDDRNYFKDAVENYNKAIKLGSELDPSELAYVFFNRSLIWLAWGDWGTWDKAKADLTDAQDRDLNIPFAFFKRHGNSRKHVADVCAKFPPDIKAMVTDTLDEKTLITMKELATNATAGGRIYIGKVVSLKATVELDAANYFNETISLITDNDKIVVFVTNEAGSPSILAEYKEGTAYDFTIFIAEITLRGGKYYVSAFIILD